MLSSMVTDLSLTGVGLKVDRPFPVDAHLTLRLPTLTCGWRTYLVRVRNCQPLPSGS